MVTAGEVIKNKRESLGKDLNSVSVDTKIQKRFLEYIENNQFEKFDSKIFATGFIKIYSKYLGLDVEKILALYRRSTLVEVKNSNKKTSVNKKRKLPKINISPKILAITTLVIFLLLIVGYVGYQIYKFQTPPSLTIVDPIDGYITNEKSTILKGLTQESVLIDVNDKQVDVNSKGEFETEIFLIEGVNTITVRALKSSNSNLETNKTLKVIYTPQQEGEDEIETKEFLITLSITQSPSWIKLDIDDENKISQVLQPNTINEFEVINKFTLVTGRVQNTKLEVNGEEIPLTASTQTGITQITCTVVENELECQ
ncbi:MAG: DUF4115 domain-containing protein [Candidatus Dojkabacteria bacterium]|jgi:cytoskeletal protein RodZ|nr:DUF4115 domain-containing protein [Candidatus Dojkabacteria bacterium]